MIPHEERPHGPRLWVDEFEFRNARPKHIAEQVFRLDWGRFLADHRPSLVASSTRVLPAARTPRSEVSHLFKLRGEIDCLIESRALDYRVKLCGEDREVILALLWAFHHDYLKPEPRRRSRAWFNVAKFDGHQLQHQSVEVTKPFPRTNAALERNYGPEFTEWAKSYVRTLRKRPSGLSIFQGGPGTGKTTFIRHLIHRLRETHSFFYIPPDQIPILTSPGSVSFWSEIGNRRFHASPVVVIEDAESLLQRRGIGGASSVSALLNSTDGLGADFLNPQIICTINCDIGDLDPALLRPGRLVALRVFRHLEHEWAVKLARSLRRPLPSSPNPTLAEIYGDAVDLLDLPDRTIGFAA